MERDTKSSNTISGLNNDEIHRNPQNRKSLSDKASDYMIQTSSFKKLHLKGELSFILGSAARKHIVCERDYFINFKPCKEVVQWGHAGSMEVIGVGDVYLKFTDNPKLYKLTDCFYVPEIGINIVSQGEIQGNYMTIFSKGKCQIRFGNNIIAHGHDVNNLFYLDIDYLIQPKEALNVRSEAGKIDNQDNYRPTGAGADADANDLPLKIEDMSPICLGMPPEDTSSMMNLSSEVDIRVELPKEISNLSNEKRITYPENLTSNICGPISPVTYDNYRFFITFLDTKTKYLRVKLLRSRDEIKDTHKSRAYQYENNTNSKGARSSALEDNATFTSKRIKTLPETKEATHQSSISYSEESNSVMDDINRKLTNQVRSIIAKSNLPKCLWGDACHTVVYLYNRTPHASLNDQTPYEAKYQKKPDGSPIKRFGLKCLYQNKRNNLKMHDYSASKGFLVGFNSGLFKVYNMAAKKCFWVKDIKIIEK
ncbi:Retrovirus-related Pol polyprotein from transposon TNT 1-94 [Erysiphe neolycopersici]|uniref:Retrovirus-related Pol polyprotein from transposon TNT 1-94 n=1 Tax=Erysiphe neolycopersici TaxID=212602 RepID=A0A420I2Z9_9PEZI|nr:Retrovirus-related Pol polyprotein from transposon TNT 1-94 [Erysiphe neolycopersici]